MRRFVSLVFPAAASVVDAKGCPVNDLLVVSSVVGCRAARFLSGEGEVVHPGDAEHGVVDAFALEAAVAEDLPGLHAGEDVLDPGPDLLVGLVVFLLPVRQFGLAALAGGAG